MRRVMLLTLLALALPTVALANSFIPDDGTTGNFRNGLASLGTTGQVFTTGPFSLDITGTDGRLILQDVFLRGNGGTGSCLVASNPCRFVENASGNFGTVEFISPQGTFKAELGQEGVTIGGAPFAGVMTKETPTEVHISANLLPIAGVFTKGTLEITDVEAEHLTSGRLVNGIAVLDVEAVSHVPEPGTLGLLELGLLGNGVIGLAGMVRRKLKLGT